MQSEMIYIILELSTTRKILIHYKFVFTSMSSSKLEMAIIEFP